MRGSDPVSSSPKRPDKGPPILLLNGYQGSLPGVKRPTRKVGHSAFFIAEVKNQWSCTSAPAICLHGVDNLTLFLKGGSEAVAKRLPTTRDT